MSRPMKFDKDNALEIAMHHIWRNGHEASSVKALSEHLGITRSSFYNAFETRDALLAAVIERYISDSVNSALYTIPAEQRFKPSVVNAFQNLCAVRAADHEHRGCLLVNSLAELNTSKNQDYLKNILENIVQMSRSRLAERIRLAQQAGEFPDDLDQNKLALALQNLSFGTNLLSKTVHKEEDLWASCAFTLEGLGFSVGEIPTTPQPN